MDFHQKQQVDRQPEAEHKSQKRKTYEKLIWKKKITGTLEGTDRGRGEQHSSIRQQLCGKTVAVECLKLRKIQDFYQERYEKKFHKSAPEEKNK